MSQEPMPTIRRRIFCNHCKTGTHHVLRGEHKRESFFDPESGYFEEERFRFWSCAGCDTGTLEESYTVQGMENLQGKQIYELAGFYPERSEHTVASKHFKQLPKKLDQIYRETILAFNSQLDLLCAAGLRALIEGICANKGVVGQKSNLQSKIDALATILPQNIVTHLHNFRFIGNEAIHELTPPKRDDLRLAIEISEDLLNFLYELDYKARRLSTTRSNSTSNQ